MAEVNTTLAAVLARIAKMPGLKGTVYAPGGLVSCDQSDPPPRPEAVSRSPYTLAAVPVLRDAWPIQLDAPSWPSRPPAPWRIRKADGMWQIEKLHTDGYEIHRYCATGPDAFATFATANRRHR
ncbi:hypothetical protein P3F83_15015 [Mycobacteroides immunogenum]|uniref:hypothetical protein n=1 Tax=Mycobacteroides immunogenum TaxID=83262 RepID=UPI0025B79BB1|nr:hypothetical protein [Mycobacteroides immunogenum]WJR31880.1 hypothetical protein P3F83_15015 [Mycobacteroides immunogenum]